MTWRAETRRTARASCRRRRRRSVGRAPAPVSARRQAGRGASRSAAPRPTPRSVRSRADARQSAGMPARRPRRSAFHTAPPPAGLSLVPVVRVVLGTRVSPASALGARSGGQYSHSPRSLQMRPVMRPSARHRPRVVRLTPSVASICVVVCQPAAINRALRCVSLCEKRTHRTLPRSKASPAPVRKPRSLRWWATWASVYSSRRASIWWRTSSCVTRSCWAVSGRGSVSVVVAPPRKRTPTVT